MLRRYFGITPQEFRFLFGFTAEWWHALILLLLLPGPGGEGGTLLALPVPLLVGMAIASAGASAYGAYKASEAGKEAAKKTSAEKNLEAEAASMVTGVDRAEVESQISQAATPIGAAIEAQQRDIEQEALMGGAAAGTPGAFTGRAAALKQQLAQEGGQALAQAAMGAQQAGEQKAQIGEERKLALMGELASLGRTRKNQQLQASLAGAQIMGGAANSAGMQGLAQDAVNKAAIGA